MRRSKKPDSHSYDDARQAMVADHLVARDIKDPRVLKAMGTVPRHLFVPVSKRLEAYSDGPLSIGMGQTISQPYVVASMTQELALRPGAKVLEIGTGCGYQAAVLAELGCRVFTVEYISQLHDHARRNLKRAGYGRVQSKVADGAEGWPEYGPYDGIIVTAAAPKLPQRLIEQLGIGGRLVVPMATDRWGRQFLHRITKKTDGLDNKRLYEVRFVPMVGAIEGR